MARYIKDFQINGNFQAIHSAINQYLQGEGYEYTNYDGENILKKGKGLMSNPSFFKFSYAGNQVRMETWMKYALLPGVYVGELGLDGIVGAAVKGPWKKRICQVESILASFVAQTTYQQHNSTFQDISSYVESETRLLNETDVYGETCILSENRGQTVGTVFCTNCGAQIPDTALFCSVCGTRRLNNDTQNEMQSNYEHASVFPSPTDASLPPSGQAVSRKEFINKYAQPSLRKSITNIAILCYVCAGLTFVVSCIVNPAGIIDALILAGLALGMHLAKSKVCAILIFVLSIAEVIFSLVVGAFPVWWLIAGISAVVVFSKIDKEYKQFLNR